MRNETIRGETPTTNETIRGEIILPNAPATPISVEPTRSLLNTFGDPTSPQLPDTIADYLHRMARNSSTTKQSSTALQSRELNSDINLETTPSRLNFADSFLADMLAAQDTNSLQRKLEKRKQWRDKDFAFVTSVKVAMRDWLKEALPIILAELQHGILSTINR